MSKSRSIRTFSLISIVSRIICSSARGALPRHRAAMCFGSREQPAAERSCGTYHELLPIRRACFVAGTRAMAREDVNSAPKALGERLFATRKLTLDLAAPLSDADATIQPFPDASPAKWHLAHTTWFFETFVLRDHVLGYTAFDERYAFLFNSYYEAEGPRHARPRRGMLSRPSLDEVRAYRAHVAEALERALPSLPPTALALVELGINHEQQHQELFLTDILATFAENPTEPGYGELPPPACFAVEPLTWHRGREGVGEIGASADGLAFGSERPRHSVLLS